MLTAFLIIFLTIFIIFYLKIKSKHNFFKIHGIETSKDGYYPIFGHSIKLLFRQFRWEYVDQIYKQKKNCRFFGLYEMSNPTIVVTDPELLKLIYVKDADSFIDRRTFGLAKKDNLFAEFLTVLKGEKWKRLRNISTPTFTTGKIKNMFPIIENKVDIFLTICYSKMQQDKFVDMKHMCSLFTLDTIVSCAFGIDVDSLNNKNSPIVNASLKALAPNALMNIKFAIMMASPFIAEFLGIQAQTKEMNEVADAIEASIKDRMKSKIKRNDYIDILLTSLKEYEESDEKSKENSYPMTMNTLVSSCILFYFAGFDTASNALAHAIYFIAKNPKEQNILREELKVIFETDSEFNYQNIMEAKYLDACFSESLRLLPPAHFVERVTTKPYKIPDTDFTIPLGMIISIPCYSIHRDPKHFEEPLRYKPERFLPENKHLITPYTYMPWGHGPRNCIGMRFALLQVKLVLAKLVHRYDLKLPPGFEMKLSGTIQTLRADGNGIKIIMESLKK